MSDLAYEERGSGAPVLLLHGLTFDRTTWRPVVERLRGSLRTIAVDLPAHGDSGGEPCRLETLAERIHDLADELGIERPVVVGHSMSGAVAYIYAGAYPTRGVVSVDQSSDVLDFAVLVRRLEPALRGDDFATAFEPFRRSMGLELVRSQVRQRIDQDVVLGYWDELLTTDPAELQARIDEGLARVDVPCLAIFGRAITERERERYARMRDAEVEEWVGDGHLLHLVEPDRFAERLRTFVAAVGSAHDAPGRLL